MAQGERLQIIYLSIVLSFLLEVLYVYFYLADLRGFYILLLLEGGF